MCLWTLNTLLILDEKRTTYITLVKVELVLLLKSLSVACPLATISFIPFESQKTTICPSTTIKPNKINILFMPTCYFATNTINGDVEKSLDLLHFQ